VHHHQQRGAHVRHGEIEVVADIVAAGLNRVAAEILLLVAPHLLRCHHEHHQAKEEYDRQPHATECRRILVDPTQEALEESPVHVDARMGRAVGSHGLWL
uniref:Uncharacterized protein n=1 Tax=Paramormyrops kingsleyae TaxID=1676925 RepID=A0A3B3SIE5_9TELE